MLNKVSLNTIGLNRIGLNRIGKPSRASSDRPYIDPEVLASLKAVCICYGKSNDDPDRAIVKNLVDPDNPFVISNASFKLNSGFGKYEEDFTSWIQTNGVIASSDKVQNSITGRFLYFNTVNKKEDVPSFKVNITLGQQSKLQYNYIKEDGTTTYIVYSESGIYTIPASYFSKYTGVNAWFGFYQIEGTSIIEQIPSFQGALVTDGVDDLIVSQKTVQEMLGGSNEITVVSMIHQIELNSTHGKGFTNYIESIDSSTSYVRTQSNVAGKTGIYGYTYNSSTQLLINNILGDKNDYEKLLANASTILSNSKFSVASGINSTNTFSSVAWYWTFIANRVLTTDEINQVIAYYNLDKYVKPDVYYDVKKQGLSNDTPDSDWYLKDFSGNGRDMQLYNYGKTPESGINEEGGLQSDGVNDFGRVENLPIYKDYTVVADREIVDGLITNADGGVATRGTHYNLGAFCFDYKDGVYSFGATNGYVDRVKPNRFISYMSKYIHNGITTPVGDAVDNNPLCIAKLGSSIDRYSKLALWSFLLFPYTLSEFLLERQLKRYKLGTLYPDMVEWRPIITGNVPYNDITIYQGTTLLYSKTVNKTGTYISKDEPIRVFIKGSSVDVVSSITVNGITSTNLSLNSNGFYWAEFPITKSPQKISYVIDEYIRYEDIVQPYPAIINLKQDGKTITWGDKLKVGSEVTFVNHTNLLPDLYTIGGGVQYNGTLITWNTPIRVEKSMVFANIHSYKKANEPNCILAPQILRIPNSSYKILGYIPDLTGKGNHGVINNSAYAGMSGANGYIEDFTTWGVYSGVILTDSTIKTNSDFKPASAWVAYKGANTRLNSFSVNITGIPKEGILNFRVNADTDTYIELSNGRNDLSFDNLLISVSSGFRITKGSNLDWSNLVIEQIGEYEGSYCLDGVDDFITIPTLSHGAKQVLMKVNWSNYQMLYAQNKAGAENKFAIFCRDVLYYTQNDGVTYIDGIRNEYLQADDLINITHNITITNDVNLESTQSPIIGSNNTHNGNFSKMALFAFMSFPEISPEEEIKELNDIVGIEGGYVESPDYYWDAYGKSNTQADDIDDGIRNINNSKMSIFDKSITGLTAIEQTNADGKVGRVYDRALTANNFAFNEESGYVNNGLVSDGVDDELRNENMPILTDYTWIMKREILGGGFCPVAYKGDGSTYLGGSMWFEQVAGGYGSCSFGSGFVGGLTFPELISYQTKTSYNGTSISPGTDIDGTKLVIASRGDDVQEYLKLVFYKAMLYSKTIDMLSINMLKNLFAKDELIDVNNPIFKK